MRELWKLGDDQASLGSGKGVEVLLNEACYLIRRREGSHDASWGK